MFLHIKIHLGWVLKKGQDKLFKLLPSSLASIFRHYKLNMKKYYWVSASDEIVTCWATQNNLLFQCLWSIKKEEKKINKSVICDHSYVKNKRRKKKSLEVLVIDWKQNISIQASAGFWEQKGTGCSDQWNKGKMGINSSWEALSNPFPSTVSPPPLESRSLQACALQTAATWPTTLPIGDLRAAATNGDSELYCCKWLASGWVCKPQICYLVSGWHPFPDKIKKGRAESPMKMHTFYYR